MVKNENELAFERLCLEAQDLRDIRWFFNKGAEWERSRFVADGTESLSDCDGVALAELLSHALDPRELPRFYKAILEKALEHASAEEIFKRLGATNS